MIKFGYFFTPLPEPRLASSPKRPFSQPQTNSALFSHAIMPTQPIQLPSCASLGIFTTLEILRDPGVLHAVCREGIATVGNSGGMQTGRESWHPLLSSGPPSVTSQVHTVICGFRQWGTSEDDFLSHLDADSERALLVAFPIAGPGTSPSRVIDSLLNKQSGALIPGGSSPLGDWISLSGWKICRSYYFPKGWPPPTPSPLVAP